MKNQTQIQAEGISKITLKMAANLETLESAVLQAKTIGQLNKLIIDYTHEEIIQAYDRLALEKQTRILKIWQAELQQKRSR